VKKTGNTYKILVGNRLKMATWKTEKLSNYIKVLFIHQLITPVSCLKNNIKIYIKTVPTCFGAVTPSSGSALFVLTKVTFVKIVH